MRCELIHDLDYIDAAWAWADARFDVAMDPDRQTEIIDDCRAVTWQRQALHDAQSADDFCFDVECDQWDSVNRWSERVQRDHTPLTYRAWWGE